MKYSMSTPISKYTSNMKNKGGGGPVSLCQSCSTIQGLHQVTLAYCSILRPSQHPPFFFVSSLHHTLVSYLDTRTHKKRCSLLTWMKIFSQILVFLEQRKQHSLDLALPWIHFQIPSTEVLGTRKPHNEIQRLQMLVVSSPIWSVSSQRGSLFFVLCSRPAHPCRLVHSSGVANKYLWLEP